MKKKLDSANAKHAAKPVMAAIFLAVLSATAPWGVAAAAGDKAGVVLGASGLPIPRFVSLKSDRVNIRQGPGLEYRIAWVFRRAGLPLEVIKEYQGWRQIRDAGGGVGWVLGAMLSGRRTALVLPWEAGDSATNRPEPATAVLKSDNNRKSRAVAIVEAGVLAGVKQCDGSWCQISISGTRGYIEQTKLWGVYQNERVK